MFWAVFWAIFSQTHLVNLVKGFAETFQSVYEVSMEVCS
jgi:hypothetical protein